MERLASFCVSLWLFFGGTECTCDYRSPSNVTYVLCATQPKTVEVGHNTSLRVHTNAPLTHTVYLHLSTLGSHIIEAPDRVELESGNSTRIDLMGKKAGIATLSFRTLTNTTDFYKLNQVQREVSIIHAKWIYYFSMVVGWIYFTAWSISFYPQIIENFRRRSVVGLNFDFLALNITGFVAYGVFNVGLFWIPKVQEQYKELHQGGVIPVQINDVVFTLHAIAATGFTIFQCFIFERGKQRMSILGYILVALLWLAVFISLFVTVGGKLSWLNFLYVFSYVKLVVTLVKYIPQAVMNCRRRSTVGWSIGSILLDFTGGVFSILQMFLISYNYNDWKSIFGDPTKFGLGALTILFDLLFMFQHYVLFRGRQPQEEKPCLPQTCSLLRPGKTYETVGVEGEEGDINDSDERTPMINTGSKKKERGTLWRVFSPCV